ncbi:putative C2 domain protein [Trypanosoma grayi]|uniref:putative C2 domain protein n=1 Tax=Trypanosoma grayi TaxID=71804 RepID=UPI0004F4A8CC|nr:putative C2 domain protein [Trypanosoma grayi]KEG10362.1 putative C2 domain protein [Trypanosoma grayi]
MATLKVTVHEARDLPIMDRTTGLADPYVVVKLNDLEYTTEIVHMSRHPVWNKVFRLDTPDLLVLQEDPLEVRLYDHDIISRDDIVGHTFVDCNSMVLQSNPSMSGWFPLFDTSAAGIRGEIRLTVKIKFHTAENPLAPRLPTRHVPRLPPLGTEHTSTGEEAVSLNPLPVLSGVEGIEPLRAMRMQHPSLTAEDEGILIFSVSRLDPSVYRVESVLTMVEELIVKADPEHSKLTNLRSTRTTNEARIVQLYKLSGKVRRQLARKVVEMQCNAVLGYVEVFDMEPNGIIVRAYGTPCVLSSVRFVDRESAEPSLIIAPQLEPRPVEVPSGYTLPKLDPSNMSLQAPVAETSEQVNNSACTPLGMVGLPIVAPVESGASLSLVEADPQASNSCANAPLLRSSVSGHVQLMPSAHETPSFGVAHAPTTFTEAPSQPAATGTRTNVLILTLKDLPSGMVEHIGGHISARSVKIVAKMKSKQMISQERDAWWMELREELRANARAFHCNVILGYEEVVLYHEDVAVLSLFGTAVMLNPTMHPLRCGPEYLFQRARRRFAARKSCSVLHMYQHDLLSRDIAGELGDLITCNVCHRRPVPEVLLMSCAMPQDIACEGQPRLVQAVVSKAKSAVRGMGLALAVSQALPYIEYTLHKQLLFNLKLQQLNAVFGIRITICICLESIIGTLTGTGCRLMGLPVPPLPRVEILDPAIRRNETVMRLQDVVAKRTRARRRHRRSRRASGMLRDSAATTPSPLSSPSSLSENQAYDSVSSTTWVDDGSGSDSASEHEAYGIGKPGKVSDYVVKIDDEEEAEIMLGMSGDLAFEDSLLLTIPYMPEWVNAFGSQERIVMHRRYTFIRTHHGYISTGAINECFAEAKRAYVQTVCRVALRRNRHPLELLRVMGFTLDMFFEPNSGALQLRLEGCLMTSTAPQRVRLMELEDRAFKECMRYLEGDSRPVPFVHNSYAGSTTVTAQPVDNSSALRGSLCSGRTVDGSATSALGGGGHAEKVIVRHVERSIFIMCNAPYALPFVFKRDVPPPLLWSNENTDAAASTLPDKYGYYRDNRARPGMIERQWYAFTSLASTAIRNVIEKIGASTDGKGGVDTRHRDSNTALEPPSGGPMLHQPMRRIPEDFRAFETTDTGVVFTPLDFVAGRTIARYVGRLSQHFIREVYEIETPTDLGVYFQQTDFEVQRLVQTMVRLMGGDTLLKHRMTYHEVWDSDGSGCASVFITVTGDVVQTSKVPLVPLSSSGGDEDEGEDDAFDV